MTFNFYWLQLNCLILPLQQHTVTMIIGIAVGL